MPCLQGNPLKTIAAFSVWSPLTVSQNIISSYSGRLRTMFGNAIGSTKTFKVIFHDFPGGAASFELIARFCYNNGRIDINPSNVYLLHCAAQFLEMNCSVSENHNLLTQIEKSVGEVGDWTWHDLLSTLKHCSNFVGTEKCIESLVGRIAVTSELSPCPSTSSPESLAYRLSCDTRSTESFKNSFSRATWWFEDLSVLSPSVIKVFIKSAVLWKFDHIIVAKFLFYYQKSKIYRDRYDKCNTTETVINLLYTLDWSSISCKSLFAILHASASLKISKSCRRQLESMIGSQLDRATLDNLLVSSPYGMNYLYDVNLVLRLIKEFVQGRRQVAANELKKVSSLMDLYMAEVAPDPGLKPLRFSALALALPDDARESHDQIYRAIDIYLEVHAVLSEEEKNQICFGLNYDKLSAEARIHVSQNEKFPSEASVKDDLRSENLSIKRLQRSSSNSKLYIRRSEKLDEVKNRGIEAGYIEQNVVNSGKIDDKEQIRAHLQGMQLRVTELEKVCRKMQTQMSKLSKSRVSKDAATTARSLPRLCS